MNGRSTRPAWRWLVPAVAAVLVIGGGAAAGAIVRQADPDLPARTAAELLADLHSVQLGALSGTVVQTADLGLPLPDLGQQDGGADLGGLWSGSNTLRVWYDGPERVRVALMDTLSQSDIIRSGRDLWIWNSREQQASHRVLPEGFATEPDRTPVHPSLTPQQAADAALAAIEPTTEVRVDEPVRVAGRDAYELVLAPRDGSSLITQVRLAIDGEHGLPLRVQVFGSAEEPGFEVAFTQISFDRPDPEQFRFNPPPGTEVTEEDLLPSLPFELGLGTGKPEIDVVGEGWTAVLAVQLPDDLELDGMLGLLGMLPEIRGDWGTGRVISGSLFSVLLTDDQRVLIGAVTPERLAEVAGG